MNESLRDRLEKYGLSLYMIRITLAASLSWVAVHTLYGDRYLYFAPLAAILITQSSIKASFEKGVYRLIGIVLGGIVSTVVGSFFHIGGLSILLMLLLGIGAATACRIDIQAISQVGVTSVLALTFYQEGYVVWRAAETAIGVAIALLVCMIVVPPKSYAKAKAMACEASLLLADGLAGLGSGEGPVLALQRAGSLLERSSRDQKELRYTLSHYQCRGELGGLNQATGHLREMHRLALEIAEEVALLPGHYAASGWMARVMAATGDCIAVYGTRSLSGAECRRELPGMVRCARELQLASFSELHAECPLAAIRDLGAVFSHLNRLLDVIEAADAPVRAPAPRQARTAPALALRMSGKGPSLKL